MDKSGKKNNLFMKIGIDISQIVYEGTGVANYVRNLVREILKKDTANNYILFGASLRKQESFYLYYNSLHCDRNRVILKTIPIPPTILAFVWNTLHIVPIEWITGPLDVFISSDWTQPPLGKARGITTVHDLEVFKHPESFDKKILVVQKRRLKRAKQECSAFLCDSKATQEDLVSLLHINRANTHLIYP